MESAASMSATESKEDFLTFRGLLDTLDCLVDVRGKYCTSEYQVEKAIEEGIIYTAKRLTELNVNTSESNALEELERLATMDQKIALQNQVLTPLFNKLRDIFHTVIDSKIDSSRRALSVDSLAEVASDHWPLWSVSQTSRRSFLQRP